MKNEAKKWSEMTPEEQAELKKAAELMLGVGKLMKEKGLDDPWGATLMYLGIPFTYGNKGGGFVRLSNTQGDGQKPSPQSSTPQSGKGEKPER